MMVCWHQQWSRTYFDSLPHDEQKDFLAWEMQRRKDRENALTTIQKDKDASIVTARALLVMLQDG